MATADRVARADDLQVLGFHPDKMHVSLSVEELELRMSDDVESSNAIHAADGASNGRLVCLGQPTQQLGGSFKETNASPTPNDLAFGIPRCWTI